LARADSLLLRGPKRWLSEVPASIIRTNRTGTMMRRLAAFPLLGALALTVLSLGLSVGLSLGPGAGAALAGLNTTIDVTHSPPVFTVGKVGLITITVRTSFTAIGTFEVQDDLPPTLVFVAVSSPDMSCTHSGQFVTCTKNGTIIGGQNYVVRILVRPTTVGIFSDTGGYCNQQISAEAMHAAAPSARTNQIDEGCNPTDTTRIPVQRGPSPTPTPSPTTATPGTGGGEPTSPSTDVGATGDTLPETGGGGVLVWTLCGLLLMAAGAVVTTMVRAAGSRAGG
jgi:hypothetical protein